MLKINIFNIVFVKGEPRELGKDELFYFTVM